MSAMPTRRLTPAEYLEIERKAEFKSEFFNGEMFAMAGAALPHNFVRDNILAESNQQLKGGPCRAISSDQRVKVGRTGLYTYPDLVFLCGDPEVEENAKPDTLLNPRVIVEVLSDSTEKYDRGAKFVKYRQMPSLQEYVLVAQDQMLIERHVRQPDGTWISRLFSDPNEPFEFAAIPVRIALADIYRGVKLPENPPLR